MSKKPVPFGEWRSPITSDMIVSQSIGFSSPQVDGADLYWLESRPTEAGRTAIVRLRANSIADVIAPPFNARTRVHEYGGGAYLADGGSVLFSNFADQRVHRVDGGTPLALTAQVAGSALRFSSYHPDQRRNRLIAVVEDHTNAAAEAKNSLASIDLATGDVTTLVDGADFYASPCLSPDGTRLAWLSWRHPNMPWDGTELWLADVDEAGRTSGSRRIAGGPSESVFQPLWSPAGDLTFVADPTGWWNIHALRGGKVVALTGLDAEFGRPLWNLDASSYAFVGPTTILCAYLRDGAARLALLDTDSLHLTSIACPYTSIEGLAGSDGVAIFIGASPTSPSAVVRFDLATRRCIEIKRASAIAIDDGDISVPEAIEFPTEDGKTAHAFYYPPRNASFEGPAGALPPVLVKSHGGPTGATSATFKLGVLYWTSRGIGVLDVNYGGSTGYGRDYRQRLIGRWGIVDVDDCVNAARYLVARGVADGERLMISGGSAGGFTTLCALTFRTLFKAGASYYGVSDIEALARDTHKFESRYLDSLIGPYPAAKATYVERSPIHFVERMTAPLLLLQGLDDKVVPPNQSQAMFDALRTKGLATAYLAFPGEQHGFRQAANIKRSLEAEFYFYARVFGYTPADPIDPVDIANL